MADLVILDKNPLKVNPLEIKDIQVMETIKENRPVFNRAVTKTSASQPMMQEENEAMHQAVAQAPFTKEDLATIRLLDRAAH